MPQIVHAFAFGGPWPFVGRLAAAVRRGVEEADLLRALVPPSRGGHGLGVRAFCDGTRALATGCPATFRERVADRVLAYTLGDRAADQPLAQSRLAAVTSAFDTTLAGWHSAIDMLEEAGASVYLDAHPIQRLQRDVETLKGHVVFDWDRTTELAGRVMLGQPLGPTDLA